MPKAVEAFRTISEVASDLEIPKHVLRFWEAKFPQIRPMKRGGGRRYYRPEDMELLRGIRRLLHTEGYTIKGVQKILRDHGTEHVKTYTLSNPLAGKTKKSLLIKENGSEVNSFKGPRRTISLPSETLKKSLGTIHSPPTERSDLANILRETISELEACKKLLLGDRPLEKEASNGFSQFRLNRG